MQGNNDIFFIWKQLTKWDLNATCFNFSLVGFSPKAMAVQFVLANKRQSTVPFCLRQCETVMTGFEVFHRNKFNTTFSVSLLQ